MIHFEIPKNQSSIIKVIGVGGGGGNAVNYMYSLGIEGVDFVVCNTDSQALAQSPIPNKIQLGPHLTQGLGAGANPEIGKQAGQESEEEITKILTVNTRMAFITAGMGGGTGTGGAPVISKICRDLGILTVGIVTTPFTYEGRKRLKQAQDGIAQMREHVDTILIISNDKLRQQFGNLPFTQAFAKADNILATAAKCITDLITVDGRVNLDFNDVQTVMKNGGVAILGSAQASGEDRAKVAVVEALSSPLLNDSEISGAKWILLNVTSAQGSSEHTLDELDIIQGYVQQQAGNTCDIILGMGHDPALEDDISVTIIATGFQQNEIKPSFPLTQKDEKPQDDGKIVIDLGVATNPNANFNQPAYHNNQNNANEVVTNTPSAQNIVDPLAPQLIIPNDNAGQIPVNNNTNSYNSNHLEQPTNFANNPTPKKEESAAEIELVYREDNNTVPNYNSNPNPNPNLINQAGDKYLSREELEDKMKFEEQKKILEERAERLRKLSFNINDSNMHEIENVPAYIRRNSAKPATDNDAANQPYLSGYSLDNNKDNDQTNIGTINTFLDGNKPD